MPSQPPPHQQHQQTHLPRSRSLLLVRQCLLSLLLLACTALPRSASADAPKASSLQCSGIADQYLEKHHKEAVPYTGSNMIYFLHVPRTAGRTFHSCFLKMGTPPSRRCPKAYDHLRIDVAVPNCYLLSSHDDFSVVSMLPENVSVLTQIRDPVDRVLSAYEFAVEVAARAVNRPANFKRRANKMATEDVWPWSYLVPWFVQEIRNKMTVIKAKATPDSGQWIYVRHSDGDQFYHNKVKKISKWNITAEESELLLPRLDPYDNEMLPSLQFFLEHPIAHELIHNGAAHQVLGITNYSHWGDAGDMRRCIKEDSHTAEALLQVAEKRIRGFVHVGTTDRLAESVASVAAALDFSLAGAAFAGGQDGVVASDPVHKREGRGNGRAPPGEDLNEITRKLRETRLTLQKAQKEMATMLRSGADDGAVAAVQARIDSAKADLIKHQDVLAAARVSGDGRGTTRALSQHAADGPVPHSPAPLASVEIPAEAAAEEAGGLAAGAGGAGARRQLLEGQGRTDNTEKKLGGNLGQEYTNCATRAHGRNMQRKDGSLQMLSMPDGRDVTFTKASRAAIPSATIDYIRTSNWLDRALHKQALEQLDAARAKQKEEGKLLDVPPSQTAAAISNGKQHPIPKPPKEAEAELR